MHLSSGTLITSTDSFKLERIQRKFAALCYTRLFDDVCNHNYEYILLRLNLLTLQLRRRRLDALFLLMFLKAKFIAHPFWILLVCAYPEDKSETTLLLL
jgi:hypothetical protein